MLGTVATHGVQPAPGGLDPAGTDSSSPTSFPEQIQRIVDSRGPQCQVKSRKLGGSLTAVSSSGTTTT